MRTLLVVDLVTKNPHSSTLMTRIATGMESMRIGDTVQLEHDDTAPVKCLSRFWEVGEHGYTLELVLSDARFDTIEARNQYVNTLESKGWMRGYPNDEQFAVAIETASNHNR